MVEVLYSLTVNIYDITHQLRNDMKYKLNSVSHSLIQGD